MTTSFMALSIAFDWHIAGWWSQCTKYSTTRDHHSHVIVTIVNWSYGKLHVSSDAVPFFASFWTVSQMIDAVQVIFIHFHREHLETIDYTHINRIESSFQRKRINNQSEISPRLSGWRNTVVNVNLCVFNVFVSKSPWFLTAFLVILSFVLMNSISQWKAVPTTYHHIRCHVHITTKGLALQQQRQQE